MGFAWPLRLEMPRERTLGGVNPGFAGRDSDGCVKPILCGENTSSEN